MSDPLDSRVEIILQGDVVKPQSRVEVLLSDLVSGVDALSSATKWIGVTTTALTDGAITNPITVNGSSVTAETGNIVSYNDAEFIFNGSVWQEFGSGGSELIFDSTPTSGSANPVTSNGIYEAIEQNKALCFRLTCNSGLLSNYTGETFTLPFDIKGYTFGFVGLMEGYAASTIEKIAKARFSVLSWLTDYNNRPTSQIMLMAQGTPTGIDFSFDIFVLVFPEIYAASGAGAYFLVNTLPFAAANHSVALTGTPTAPTAAAGTNTTQIATTAFVQTAVSAAISDAIGGAY